MKEENMIVIDFEPAAIRVKNRDGEVLLSKANADTITALCKGCFRNSSEWKSKPLKDKRLLLKDHFTGLKNQLPMSLLVGNDTLLVSCDRRFFVDNVGVPYLNRESTMRALRAVGADEDSVVDETSAKSLAASRVRLKARLDLLSMDPGWVFPCTLHAGAGSICTHATCKQPVYDGRQYCSNYHHAFQVICDERKKFEKEGGPYKAFRLKLCDTLMDQMASHKKNSGRNKLQPGTSELKAPLTFANALDVLEFYEPLLPVYLALHRPRVNGEESVVMKDQRVRAYWYAKTLSPDPRTIARLMFGYEGFFIVFLMQVREIHGKQRLKELKVEVVDIDENVTNWHAAMLPCSNISCRTEDIFKGYTRRTHLYANFCGISESWEATIAFLDSARSPLLLSFSTARAAKCKDLEASLKGHSKGKGWRVKKIGNFRQDFVTYFIFPAVEKERYRTAINEFENSNWNGLGG